MNDSPNRILLRVIGFLYVLFLTGMLLFGRAFSVVSFGYIGAFPLYISDCIMVLSFIFLAVWLYYQNDITFSFWGKSGYLLFCSLSFVYLFLALLVGRTAAVRDIVLNGYMVYGLIVYLLLKNFRISMRSLFVVFVSISLVLIFAYRSRLVKDHFFVYGIIDSSKMKIFNLTLYGGLFFACCLGWICSELPRYLRAIALFIAIGFGSLIVASDNRTTLIAFIGLILFFLFSYPYRLKKKMFTLLFILSGILFGFIYDKQLYYKKDDMIRASFESIVLMVKKPNLVIGQKQLVVKNDRPAVPAAKTVPTPESEATLSHSFKQLDLRENELNHIYQDDNLRENISQKLSNLSWRLDVWKAYLRRVKRSAVFGVGFGVYPDLSNLGIVKPRGFAEESGLTPAHNEVITIFYKMGLLGLLVYVYMQWYFVTRLQRAKKYLPRNMRILNSVIIGCLVYWHIMALSFDVIDSPPTNIMLWILLGVSAWLIQFSPSVESKESA